MKVIDAIINCWCPFVQVSSSDKVAVTNRGDWKYNDEFQRRCKCLGNKCMAWKWINEEAEEGCCGLIFKSEGL